MKEVFVLRGLRSKLNGLSFQIVNQHFVQLRDIDGFGNEMLGNAVSDVHFKSAGENDKRRVGQGVGTLREFDSSHAGHFNIGNQKRELFAPEERKRLPPVLGYSYGVALTPEGNRQR